MNQQPDKLFRDKLENYQKPVSASVWDRIADTAPVKKNNSRTWLKIAASFLLLATSATTWLWLRTPENYPSPIAQDHALEPTTVPSISTPDQPMQHIAGSGQDTTVDKKNEHIERAAKTPNAVKVIKRNTGKSSSLTAANPVAIQNDPVDPASKNALVDESLQLLGVSNPRATADSAHSGTGIPAPVLTEAHTGNVTLTYSMQDVSAYLDKNIEGNATEDDKKQSTLKKLLQKANDLKTNQDAFGELRQRKNEILALNFKNDKRGQKTRN